MGNSTSELWRDDEDENFFNTKPSSHEFERLVQQAINALAKAKLQEAGGESLDISYEDSLADTIMYQTKGMRFRPVRNVPFGFMTGIQFKGKDVSSMTEDFSAGLKEWQVPVGAFSYDTMVSLKPDPKRKDYYYDSDSDFEEDNTEKEGYNFEKDKDGNYTGICMIFHIQRPEPAKKRGRPAKTEEVTTQASAKKRRIGVVQKEKEVVPEEKKETITTEASGTEKRRKIGITK